MKEAWTAKPVEVAGRRFDFDAAQDAWRQADYADQETIALTPAAKDLAALRKDRPVIDQFIGLGDNVVFELTAVVRVPQKEPARKHLNRSSGTRPSLIRSPRGTIIGALFVSVESGSRRACLYRKPS